MRFEMALLNQDKAHFLHIVFQQVES